MEGLAMASHSLLPARLPQHSTHSRPMLSSGVVSSYLTNSRRHSPSYSTSSASLSTSFISPSGGSVTGESLRVKTRPQSLNPVVPSSRSKRNFVTRVIPFHKDRSSQQLPPDLASYIFKNRIVYLGMPFSPAVTELLVAEFSYLEYEDETKPIYLYINSTGIQKHGEELGYETEAFAIHDIMRTLKPPVHTLCVGNAWGEAAILLAAGTRGNRSALPSSSIMIRQPMAQYQGQTTDVELAAKELKNVKNDMVELYAKYTRKTTEQIEEDILRPKYFSPDEAVEYGLIDKVINPEKSKEDTGLPFDPRIAKFI